MSCRIRIPLFALIALLLVAIDVSAQRKRKKPPAPAAQDELAKLHEQFVNATKDYKSSLEKLLPFHESALAKAEKDLEKSKKLQAEGLIAKKQVEESERAVAAARDKVSETRKQMTTADAQIASALQETAANEKIAKDLRLAKQRLVRTAGFTRFTGAPGWNLGEAYKIQRFFSDTFNKQLPIAVFGQGAIHDRWRLDHRNSMDISLNPDGQEGQILMDFLRRSGVPFLAFREAIPGAATGPHIHVGRPSHRY